MTSIHLYGIPNCDSVRKARSALQAQGRPHVFHDVRKEGLAPGRLDAWLAAVGWQTLLNRKGTGWRALDDATRAAVVDAGPARALMLQRPVLVKRPVVEWDDGRVTVGLDAVLGQGPA